MISVPEPMVVLSPGRRAALAILLAAACAGGDPAPRAVVRDSAGITIVENTAPARETWLVVEADPVIDLGASGASEDEFSGVQGVELLADGGVVVGDRGAQELRFFGPNGAFRFRAGRKGGGPGEFEALGSFVRLPGDTLAVWDFSHRRLSLFAPDGSLVRELTAQPGGLGFPIFIGILPDGPWVMRGGSVISSDDVQSGVSRARHALVLYSPEGEPGDTIGSFNAHEMVVQVRRTGSQVTSVRARSLPFGRDLVVGLLPDGIVAAANDDWTIAIHDPDGGPRRIIRRAHEPRQVTSADLDGLPESEQAALEGVRTPETMPAFGPIVVGPGATIWVQEYQAPGDVTPVLWNVFDPDGRWAGNVVFPPRFSLRVLRDDLAAGVWRDPDDVEHVRVYRLREPESAP